MNEARELLRIARSLVGGTVQPPPAMVDIIYRWAKAQLAAHRLWHQLDDAEGYRILVEKRKAQLQEAKEKGYDESEIESIQDSLRRNQNSYEQDMAVAERLKEEVALFPRVSVKKWNRVKRKFKVDMSGWRYKGKVDDADPKRKMYADNAFGVITVELVRGDISTKGKGYWDAGVSTIRIKTGGDLKWVVEHELIHWAQSYMNIILGVSGEFGKPSREIRTPDVSQWANKELERKLKTKGIDPGEFHGLDDVEFYTELLDEIGEFERKLRETRALETFGSKEEFFNVFVGGDQKKSGLYVSNFFAALRKHAMGKWKKAVSELAKAVL